MRILTCLTATIPVLLFVLAGTLHRAGAADIEGACCLPHGSCLDGYDFMSCGNVGGSYIGDSTLCSSVTCEPVPCGESGAPVCGGTCPAGQRCVDTEDLHVLLIFTTLVATDETTQASCECVDVRCGGAPLENGQGCCAGVPFTIGVEGCCNGEVVPVDTPCSCGERLSGATSVETTLAPIDLRDTGCCTLGIPPGAATDSPTEEGVLNLEFNVVEGGCCQRPFLDGNPGQDPLVASGSTYTFGTGLDCCPGGPIAIPTEIDGGLQELLDASGLCAGGCFEGECASQDCCRCDECQDGMENSCISAGSQFSCEGLCNTGGCQSFTYVPNAMCTEDGSCAPSAAAAPATSPTGLVALLAALLTIGGFAILGRRRRTS